MHAVMNGATHPVCPYGAAAPLIISSPCMVRWAPVALVLAASGCAALAPQAWHRTEPPSVVKHPYQEKQAQVWPHGHLEEVWHALIISPDSVTGIPAELPTMCDTCP